MIKVPPQKNAHKGAVAPTLGITDLEYRYQGYYLNCRIPNEYTID